MLMQLGARRVLITGATGYIGSVLASRLVTLGWDVHVLVRADSTGKPTASALTQHTYTGSTSSVIAALSAATPGIVFHLAACTKSSHNHEDVEPMVLANVMLGSQILEGMKLVGCRNLVTASTYWEYDVDGGYSPNTLYAATKRAFRDVVEFYARADRIRAITLVLYDVYGPRDWRAKFIPRLVQARLSRAPIPATRGEQMLDLVYIDDVIEGFVRAGELLDKGESKGHRVFALSSGCHTSVKELVALLESVTEARLDVQWGELPYPQHQIFAPTRSIPQLPGWRPKMTLEEGLKKVISQS